MAADLGARIAAAFAPMARAMVYRVTATATARTATALAAGGTAVTLTTAAAFAVGDVLTVGGPVPKVVTNSTAVGPDAALIAFTPAATSAVVVGTAVSIARHTDQSCAGWEEATDLTAAGGLLAVGDRIVMIMASSLPAVPEVGAKLIIDGQSLTIQTVASDGLGAVWRLIVRK